MRIYTTVPTHDPGDAGRVFRKLAAIEYDGSFAVESEHDPFFPLVIGARS
ncbi:MAG: hypothetical protein U0587_04775 [Candidatus Binatia bacterium]